MIQEKLGLELEADAKEWTSGFEQSEQSVKKLGKAVDEVVAKTGHFGKALSAAASTGTGKFGELLQQQQKAIKSFDALINRSEAAGKKQEGIWDKITGKLVSAEFYTQAVGKALDVAGKYLAGAFERAKIDPALAAMNELRLATEGWIKDVERGLDSLLNKGAQVIQSTAHGFSARQVEFALEERARRNGTSVDQERQRYVNDQYAGGLALGGYGGTEEQRGVGGVGSSFFTGAAFQGKDVAQWGATRKRTRTQRTYGGISTVYDTVGGTLAGAGQAPGSWGDTSTPTIGGALTGFGRFGGSGMYAANGNMPNVAGQQREIEKLNAALGDQTSAIGGSLAALTGGLTAAVDAAISGHESIGKAALKGAGAVLKSIALQATGYAAFEAAQAWVFPAAAALHLTAAAKMAGVAALTGVLAAGAGALAGGGGGGGARGSSAATGGYASRPSSGPGGQGGNTIIVNINGFYGDEKQAIPAIHRGLEKAEQARRVRPASSRVVRYGEAA